MWIEPLAGSPGRSEDASSEVGHQAAPFVVEADDDDATGSEEPEDGMKSLARLGCVVEYAATDHYVERFLLEARPKEIHLAKGDSADVVLLSEGLREAK